MTKFMNRENWFITHVIREICQNLHVKQDHDPLFYPLMNGVTIISRLNSLQGALNHVVYFVRLIN